MRLTIGLGIYIACGAIAAWGETTDPQAWHRLVGILQYLEADYPGAVASQDAFELAEQKSFMAEALSVSQQMGPQGAGFVEKLKTLQADVNAGQNPEGVSRACGKLVAELTETGKLVRSPKRPPDVSKGAVVYQENCARCHGETGNGEAPNTATMKPPPANFLDSDMMEGLSPYRAFNTTAFGITGTAMPAFPQLTEDDRWNVAFFLFTLRHPPAQCDDAVPPASLEQLATSTDAELAAALGPDFVACLRRKLPMLDEMASMRVAQEHVQKALAYAHAQEFEKANAELLDGYLLGLEPVEVLLRSRDKELVTQLEHAFMEARAASEKKNVHATEAIEALRVLLEKSRHASSSSGFLSVFVAALLILVREGFEAMVVVGALLAVLKKMGATQHSRMVHLGWILALIVGAVLFGVGQKLLAGANREWMEGVVALAAVAMLVYAAMWLNSKAQTREMMGELRQHMQSALGKGSLGGLFFISFSAVFRESFETALFLQGLATDSVRGTLLGALAGLLALTALVVFINQVGFRLPMKQLFSASTWLLMGTSVVMLGKGIRALQEVGALPLSRAPFFEIDFLGIYADWVTLVPQILLATVLVVWERRQNRRSTMPPKPTS